MTYGFFNTANTSKKTTFTPEKISFTNRADMALAVLITDFALANKALAKTTLSQLGLNANLPNLALPQAMATWLYPLTNAIKQHAITADYNHSPSNAGLWLMHCISRETPLKINLAETINNQTLSKKTDSSRPVDIAIHTQRHQVLYTVQTQFGDYFKFLNQRVSHPTDAALDTNYETYIREQITRAEEHVPQQARKLEAAKNDLLTTLSSEQIQKNYLSVVGENAPSTASFIPYNSPTEAQAIRIAEHTATQLKAQENLQLSSMSHPHI